MHAISENRHFRLVAMDWSNTCNRLTPHANTTSSVLNINPVIINTLADSFYFNFVLYNITENISTYETVLWYIIYTKLCLFDGIE